MASPDLRLSLQRELSAQVGHDVVVSVPVQLSGGASKESWAFDLVDGSQTQRLILRRDPPGAAVGSLARDDHAVLDAAGHAGVPVPRVLWSGAVEEWEGATYIVMESVDGETLAPRILRDPSFAAARDVLLAQCAHALARIHAVGPSSVAPPLVVKSVDDLIDEVQIMLDAAPNAHPAFELAIRWLRLHVPDPVPPALVHADFRMGNLIVGPEGLRAVLDWELAHVGDPRRDLGYFCVRSWRFGADDRPAGGLGSRADWMRAYAAAGGAPVDPHALHFWEVYGTTVWGVQTTYLTQQVLRHGIRSVELAAIGRRAVEMEWDVLQLLSGQTRPQLDETPSPAWTLSTQDRPSATELLAVTADFLHHDVMPALDGRLAFHARVAGNVLRIVERELTLAPHHDAADRDCLASLLDTPGADTHTMLADLAHRIRRGDFDSRDDVIAALQSITARKLAIANPRHLRAAP